MHEQLGLSEDDMKLEQRFADAIVLCQIHSILTDMGSTQVKRTHQYLVTTETTNTNVR